MQKTVICTLNFTRSEEVSKKWILSHRENSEFISGWKKMTCNLEKQMMTSWVAKWK